MVTYLSTPSRGFGARHDMRRVQLRIFGTVIVICERGALVSGLLILGEHTAWVHARLRQRGKIKASINSDVCRGVRGHTG